MIRHLFKVSSGIKYSKIKLNRDVFPYNSAFFFMNKC